MKTIIVTLQGTSPLLINRFKESSEIPATLKKNQKKDYGTPRSQAEATAYQDPDGRLWIPSTWIQGCIAAIASDYKLPGSRKSVKSVSGGCVRPIEEKLYFTEGYTIKNLEVDSRPCVIQRARIMRHRARLESWSVCVVLELDDEIIPTDDLHQIISDSGKRAGLGDFRPQRGGPFGRFCITSWKVS